MVVYGQIGTEKNLYKILIFFYPRTDSNNFENTG